MSSTPLDFEGMLREIKAIQEKYGVPKGVIFVPDKLEITLQRLATDKFSLSYQESFSYLPEYASNFATQTAIQLLQQSGLPISNITRLEKGVKMEMTTDLPPIVAMILSELIMQRLLEESEFLNIVIAAKKGKEMFTSVSDPCWTWNENIANRLNNLLQKLIQIVVEHPSYLSEMEEIVRKYMPKQPTTEETRNEQGAE